MSTNRRIVCVALALAAVTMAIPRLHAQSGGDYDLTWWSIDSGGGRVSGGDYTLTGSIGQPDAMPVLMGGDYTLTGGFLAKKPFVPTSSIQTWPLY